MPRSPALPPAARAARRAPPETPPQPPETPPQPRAARSPAIAAIAAPPPLLPPPQLPPPADGGAAASDERPSPPGQLEQQEVELEQQEVELPLEPSLASAEVYRAVQVYEANFGLLEGRAGFQACVPGTRVANQRCELLGGVLERHRALERAAATPDAEASLLEPTDETAQDESSAAGDRSSFTVSRTASRLLGLSQADEHALLAGESDPESDSETETESEDGRDQLEAHTARGSQLLAAGGWAMPAVALEASLFLSPASELHSELPSLMQQSTLHSDMMEESAAAESTSWQSWEDESSVQTAAATSPSMIGAAIPLSESRLIQGAAAALWIDEPPSPAEPAAIERGELSIAMGATTDETETESEEEHEQPAHVVGAGSEYILSSRTGRQLDEGEPAVRALELLQQDRGESVPAVTAARTARSARLAATSTASSRARGTPVRRPAPETPPLKPKTAAATSAATAALHAPAAAPVSPAAPAASLGGLMTNVSGMEDSAALWELEEEQQRRERAIRHLTAASRCGSNLAITPTPTTPTQEEPKRAISSASSRTARSGGKGASVRMPLATRQTNSNRTLSAASSSFGQSFLGSDPIAPTTSTAIAMAASPLAARPSPAAGSRALQQKLSTFEGSKLPKRATPTRDWVR